MGAGHEDVGDEVFFLRGGAGLPPAAASLRAVLGQGRALDVAGVRQGHHHRLVGDEVLARHLAHRVDDLRAPRVGEALPHIFELGLDDGEQRALVLENVLEAGDLSAELEQLVEQLVVLQAGEALQPHRRGCSWPAPRRSPGRTPCESPWYVGSSALARAASASIDSAGGRGVDARQMGEVRVLGQRRRHHVHQRPARLVGVLRRADDGDDVVEEVLAAGRDQQALDDVQAVLRLLELEAAAPGDDLAPVEDELLEDLLERQDARLALVDGQHHDAVRHLHRGVLRTGC